MSSTAVPGHAKVTWLTNQDYYSGLASPHLLVASAARCKNSIAIYTRLHSSPSLEQKTSIPTEAISAVATAYVPVCKIVEFKRWKLSIILGDAYEGQSILFDFCNGAVPVHLFVGVRSAINSSHKELYPKVC